MVQCTISKNAGISLENDSNGAKWCARTISLVNGFGGEMPAFEPFEPFQPFEPFEQFQPFPPFEPVRNATFRDLRGGHEGSDGGPTGI